MAFVPHSHPIRFLSSSIMSKWEFWYEGVEGDISSFEALINELYHSYCRNDFELSHLVSSMKPTANVPDVDME